MDFYSMPEVFNKTGHGLTDITASAEFKPMLHPELFWAWQYIHLLYTRVELKALHYGWSSVKIFIKI